MVRKRFRCHPPDRINVLTSVTGISFDEAMVDGESFELDGRQIPVIGRVALLKNKSATGKAQDLADIVALKDT